MANSARDSSVARPACARRDCAPFGTSIGLGEAAWDGRCRGEERRGTAEGPTLAVDEVEHLKAVWVGAALLQAEGEGELVEPLGLDLLPVRIPREVHRIHPRRVGRGDWPTAQRNKEASELVPDSLVGKRHQFDRCTPTVVVRHEQRAASGSIVAFVGAAGDPVKDLGVPWVGRWWW